MPKRRFFSIASATIVLTLLVVLFVGAPKTGPTLPACGGTRLPDGTCVGIPMPGNPDATCIPQYDGSCSWFWQSPYVTH